MEKAKRLLIVIHGLHTSFKEEVMKDLKDTYENFTYIESDSPSHEIIKHYQGDLLINTTHCSEPTKDAMNVYIDCPTVNEEHGPDNFTFTSQNEVRTSSVAGTIIIEHVRWCRAHDIAPVY